MKASHRVLQRGAFACLVLITFLMAIGNTGLISIMPTIGRTIGITDMLVASVFSLSALVWAIASPFWAGVADRHRRKPLIQLGMMGFIASMLGCSLAVHGGLIHWLTPLATFIAFFLCRATYGIFGSAAATATQVYIADHTDRKERVQTLSALAGALSLGTIFGPAIAPFLILPPFGLLGPMLSFALLAMVALALSVVLIPKESPVVVPAPQMSKGPPPSGRFRALMLDEAIAPFLLYGAVLASVQAINIYSIGFVVIDRAHHGLREGQMLIGLVMGCGAVAGLIGQWGLVRWLSLMPSQMVRWGAILALAGNALMMIDGGITLLAMGFSVASLGYGLGRPGFSAGASIAGRTEQQAGIAAAVSSIAGGSIVVPPIIALALYRQWPLGPFAIAIVALLAVCAYALRHPALGRKPVTVS